MGWPKYLKKTYTKEELQIKVLKKLQLAHDREFMASLFVAEKRGEWRLKEDLTKDEKKRLKKIVKEIKKGRGGVKILPLVILLILAGVIAVFTVFFKNPMAEMYLERSLASIFGATSEAEGVSVSLSQMELRWDRISVADASDLDHNLFEVGETVIRMNGRALLQKKAVIESLVCLDAGWGAERDVPGELVGPKSSDSAGDMSDGDGLFSADNFQTEQTDRIFQAASDPEQFVDEQWDSLETPVLADELSAKYRTELDDRKASIEEVREQASETVSDGKELLGQDFSRYKSHPDEIPALAEEAGDFYDEADEAGGNVSDELAAVRELRKSLESDKAALDEARKKDLEQMKSLVSIPDGGVRGIVNSLVQSYLYSLFGDKYLKAVKIADFAGKYRDEGKDKKAGENKQGRSGRIVSFETVIWPDFLLKEGRVSAGGSGFSWDADLADLAGNPDQWDKPVSGELMWNKGSGVLEGTGIWERRSDIEEASRGDFLFEGLPLSTDALSSLGIARAEGSTGGTAELTVEREGVWNLAADITVSDPELEKSGDDLTADVVYSVLSGKDWQMSLIASGGEGDLSFALDWPLLDSVDNEIGGLLKEQAAGFLDEAEDEYLKRYAEKAGFLDDYLGEVSDWEALLNGDFSSLDSVKSDVGDKVDEVKEEAAGQAQEEVNEVLDNTGAGDAVKDVQKAIPKLF